MPARDEMRERRLMSRAGAALLTGGGALGLLVIALPHSDQINEIGYAACAAVSVLAAAIVIGLGPRLPRLAFPGIALLGTALVTASIYLSGEQANAAAENELIYLW